MSEKAIVLHYLFREEPRKGIILFAELLTEIAEQGLKKTNGLQDTYVEKNINRYWSYLKNIIATDSARGLITPYRIVDENRKKIEFTYFDAKIQRISHALIDQPAILEFIDTLTAREYEALGLVCCELLGANKLKLTPPGNEAGIDFICSLSFRPESHFLIGLKGPIRIIGQSKKYADPVKVSSIKEFNSTIGDVRHLTEKVRAVLPTWFNENAGPILGWFVGHKGFQSGSHERAKNFGVLLSESREISQLIATAKVIKQIGDRSKRIEALRTRIKCHLE